MRKEITELTFDQIKQITKEYGCASITDLGTCEKIHEVLNKETKICLFKKGSHLIVAFFLLQAGAPVCYSKNLLSASGLSRIKTMNHEKIAA